ncbi:MAG: OmpH family outer membrane protein [Dysgonamonadaceae bacterium]|jgi:outer membrane protein|nr:OmpH family outer membrane protein [Dysgonamonadaceae bacterium]
MFRNVLVTVLLLLPFGVFAQESLKIAYVNSEEILMAMPETAAMRAELEKYSNQIDSELKIMEDELSKKYTAYMQQADTLAESIKTHRMQDIQDLRQRAETYNQGAQQEFAKKRQDLFTPIQQKLLDAIKAVGEENGYTYVLEQGAFLYISTTSATNATPLIKKKLGLQ